MARLFWLSDDQWASIEPHLPKSQPGAQRMFKEGQIAQLRQHIAQINNESTGLDAQR